VWDRPLLYHYKTRAKLYVWVFQFLCCWTEGWNTEVPQPNGSNHSSNLTLSELPHELKHNLLHFFSKYLNFATLSEEMLTSFVFIMSFCSKFFSSHMNIHLVSSTLTSSPIYLQVTKKASVSYLFCTQ